MTQNSTKKFKKFLVQEVMNSKVSYHRLRLNFQCLQEFHFTIQIEILVLAVFELINLDYDVRKGDSAIYANLAPKWVIGTGKRDD